MLDLVKNRLQDRQKRLVYSNIEHHSPPRVVCSSFPSYHCLQSQTWSELQDYVCWWHHPLHSINNDLSSYQEEITSFAGRTACCSPTTMQHSAPYSEKVQLLDNLGNSVLILVCKVELWSLIGVNGCFSQMFVQEAHLLHLRCVESFKHQGNTLQQYKHYRICLYCWNIIFVFQTEDLSYESRLSWAAKIIQFMWKNWLPVGWHAHTQ